MNKNRTKSHSRLPPIARLLSLIPEKVFGKTTTTTQSDRYDKQMKSKDYFICLSYPVLTRNSGLRDIYKTSHESPKSFFMWDSSSCLTAVHSLIPTEIGAVNFSPPSI
ncbi:MAG: hypothetical protein ACJAXX_002487 [Roseivirga sp.]|jgi:hypothetical protein